MLTVFSYLAGYLAIWLVVCLLWWVFKGEKYGITGIPYLLIYRTSRLNNLIERLAAGRATFWRTVWNLGIVVGVGAMILGFFYFLRNLWDLLFVTAKASPVQPLVPVPGLGVSNESFPYIMLALAILVITHELSHGIAAVKERIPLKATGLIWAHVLPAAFVEPDEEKLNSAKPATKLRIFAAGSFTNIVLGIIFVLLIVNFSSTVAPFYNIVGSGVTIGSVPASLPAHAAGVQAGEIVTGINGTRISNIVDLQRFMAPVAPGSVVALQTNNGTFIVRTTADPTNSSHALIGIGGLSDQIVFQPKMSFLPSELPWAVYRAEFWLQGLLVGIGMINMLPIPILDGDKFMEASLNLLRVKKAKEIRQVTNYVALGIFVLNIVLSLYRFGYVRF
jgi:membrane-associated protease RseP (regulator of RpoE activity)